MSAEKVEKISIQVGDVKVEAELFDTETARDIAAALPIEVDFNTWGDEFYFPVPVTRAARGGPLPHETARRLHEPD